MAWNESFSAMDGGGWGGDASFTTTAPSDVASRTAERLAVPVTITDLVDGVSMDNKYSLGEYKFETVLFMGTVSSREEVGRTVTYVLADPDDTSKKFIASHNLGNCDGTPCAHPHRMALGSRVRAHGKLHSFNGEHYIVAHNIKEVSETKEYHIFTLEAKVAKLYFSKSVPQRLREGDCASLVGTCAGVPIPSDTLLIHRMNRPSSEFRCLEAPRTPSAAVHRTAAAKQESPVPNEEGIPSMEAVPMSETNVVVVVPVTVNYNFVPARRFGFATVNRPLELLLKLDIFHDTYVQKGGDPLQEEARQQALLAVLGSGSEKDLFSLMLSDSQYDRTASHVLRTKRLQLLELSVNFRSQVVDIDVRAKLSGQDASDLSHNFSLILEQPADIDKALFIVLTNYDVTAATVGGKRITSSGDDARPTISLFAESMFRSSFTTNVNKIKIDRLVLGIPEMVPLLRWLLPNCLDVGCTLPAIDLISLIGGIVHIVLRHGEVEKIVEASDAKSIEIYPGANQWSDKSVLSLVEKHLDRWDSCSPREIVIFVVSAGSHQHWKEVFAHMATSYEVVDPDSHYVVDRIIMPHCMVDVGRNCHTQTTIRLF